MHLLWKVVVIIQKGQAIWLQRLCQSTPHILQLSICQWHALLEELGQWQTFLCGYEPANAYHSVMHHDGGLMSSCPPVYCHY